MLNYNQLNNFKTMTNKNLIEAERPSGFLDFLPEECLAREKMLKTIEKTFRSFGFDFMETPIVEFEKILKGEESETGKQIFSIFSSDTKGENLNLRFDHTVPFARVLASNPYNSQTKTGIKLPFKRMVLGPVFRGERPQQGRYRQFYQFDVDIAGSDLILADAEIVTLMWQTMKNLGVENFVIRINNRKILSFFNAEIIRLIDKIDKLGIDEIVAQIENNELKEKVKTLLSISGNNFEKLEKCSELFQDSPKAQEGIQELKQILEILEKAGVDEKNIKIDFSIARGLDYYTGTVMETNLLDAPEFGSVFSGGRYNQLVKRFTGQNFPVVGASIGVDRLFSALEKLNLLDKNQKTSAEVMILRLSENWDDEYFNLAQKIRKSGLNTTICYLNDTTFKRQFNFALNSGVKFVVIMGEDERKNGVVQVKNLETREQVEARLSEVENYFGKK